MKIIGLSVGVSTATGSTVTRELSFEVDPARPDFTRQVAERALHQMRDCVLAELASATPGCMKREG